MVTLNNPKNDVATQLIQCMEGLRLNKFELSFLSSVRAWCIKHMPTQKQVDACNLILAKASARGSKSRCEDAPCCGCCR